MPPTLVEIGGPRMNRDGGWPVADVGRVLPLDGAIDNRDGGPSYDNASRSDGLTRSGMRNDAG